MRRYHVTTFGCQMNAHDSERIKGLLEELGLGEAPTQAEADVLVFNTCTIREKPDQRLAAHLGNARALKRARSGPGDRGRGLLRGGAARAALRALSRSSTSPSGPARSRISASGSARAESASARARSESRTSDIRRRAPGRRERRLPGLGADLDGLQLGVRVLHRARGARSRGEPPARRDPRRGRTSLPRDGVREVTLLGQNVNSWGRDLAPRRRDGLRRAPTGVDGVDGIERIRFTSPHPKDFRRAVIDAMAECDAVCEHAHLPLQSGSTRY